MTQVVSVQSIRPAESRLIAAVCAAHMMSHYYMLMLAPLFVFIRADFNVSYTELALALTVFNVVSGLLQTPVGFLVDRIGARVRADRGIGAVQHRLCGRRRRRFLLGLHRDVRRRRSRQHRVSPFRLFAVVASRAAGTAQPCVFVSHLRRHGRLGHRAGDVALHAKRVRLARRLYRRVDFRLAGSPGADCATRARRRNQAQSQRAPQKHARPSPMSAGGSCCRRRSCSTSPISP